MSSLNWDREARWRRQRLHGLERAKVGLEEAADCPRPDLEPRDRRALEKAQRKLAVSHEGIRQAATTGSLERRQKSLLTLLVRLDRNRDKALRTLLGMYQKRRSNSDKALREFDRRIDGLRSEIEAELTSPRSRLTAR